MDKTPKLTQYSDEKVKKPFYGLLEKNFAQCKSFTQVKRNFFPSPKHWTCMLIYAGIRTCMYTYIWLALPYVKKIYVIRKLLGTSLWLRHLVHLPTPFPLTKLDGEHMITGSTLN